MMIDEGLEMAVVTCSISTPRILWLADGGWAAAFSNLPLWSRSCSATPN
jgi:hypothetical protein